jgi:hypothetical protein
MSRLLLGNLDPATTDEEIRAFLVKYGFPSYDTIEHEHSEGPRPGVLVTFDGIDATALGKFHERIHNIHWKKRKLSAQVLRDRFA